MSRVSRIRDVMLTSSHLPSPKLPSQKGSNPKESTRTYEWIETHHKKEQISPTVSMSSVPPSHWEENSTQRKKLTLQRAHLGGFLNYPTGVSSSRFGPPPAVHWNTCRAHQSPSEPMDRKSYFAL